MEKTPPWLLIISIYFGSLVFVVAGLYLMVNYSRLFRGIRIEFLRRNLAAWMIIFCLSTGMIPMSGGFNAILGKYGVGRVMWGQVISTTLCTLFVFNIARFIAEHPGLKKLSFLQHKLLVLVSLVILLLSINIPAFYVLYGEDIKYLPYSILSSIYLAGATGLVYAMVSWLDIARKRKFDEKELELSLLRELKSKAELDALHSKVNPHFLYNALNSIADLAVTDGKKARRMTIALADLFRYSINYSQNNYSTVNDEVAMTEVYLQIEKIRFEDQLNYSIRVEEGAGHYLLPRFLLQPLVENAVKHGLKVTGKMTEILLQVEKKEDQLIITIVDNGPRFPDDLVPGYGVKSVFDKLDLLFSGQYEIHFTNEPRKQVSIFIHKLLKNEPGV